MSERPQPSSGCCASPPAPCTLDAAPRGARLRLERVDGERAFRRRLLELGLLPGTLLQVVRVAPLGDPLELSVRGTRLSIRSAEARQLLVTVLEPA
ncbi:MAG: FeoA domain-containing protein [Polyangiaceae bacterium]|nr:FeoA domain-containing protein [Polyangiaceae bacterium]MCW5791990.1 FeoA domain-containing protein [Polyangiaceae bacterium]